MAWISSPAVEFVCFLIFICSVYIFATKRKSKSNKHHELPLPPGPTPWPLVGNLHLLGSLPHVSITELGKIYGPIIYLHLGSVPTVVASSPAMAREFLKTYDLIFASRPLTSAAKYITYGSKDVVMAPYGEYWRKMRKWLTVELLTVKRTETFGWIREDEASAMVRSVWEESMHGVKSVNLRKHIFALTLNVMCRSFAGRSYADHKLSGGQDFTEMVIEIMHLLGAVVIGDLVPFLAFRDWGGHIRRMKAVFKIYDQFAEKVIDEHVDRRRAKNLEAHDMVDVMLDLAESESQGLQVSRLQIKAIILDMLVGGVDTTSSAIEWAMTELLKNPRAMAKAKQEIELKVGRDRIVKESDLVDLEYLSCVVKETFRLHPAGPFLVPRETTEGCNVGGYYVPPKTRVFVNVWAIGRDERLWEEPLEFKPERFIGSSIDLKGQDFELLAFGSGRRGCPGMISGLRNVYLALAQFIHCFDWSVDGELDRDEVFGLSLPRKLPLCAIPCWRLTTEGPR